MFFFLFASTEWIKTPKAVTHARKGSGTIMVIFHASMMMETCNFMSLETRGHGLKPAFWIDVLLLPPEQAAGNGRRKIAIGNVSELFVATPTSTIPGLCNRVTDTKLPQPSALGLLETVKLQPGQSSAPSGVHHCTLQIGPHRFSHYYLIDP
jgi:hypothetical protein